MKALSEATNARQFFQLWLSQAKGKGKGFSFEALAKRGGFSSRSYVRQVLVGEKRITIQGLPRFLKILKLDKNHERLLRLFLERDEADFNFEGRTRANIEADIQAAREKINLKQRRKMQVGESDGRVLRRMSVLYPYLSRTEGRELDVICEKSKIASEECAAILDAMMKENLVEISAEKYFATERLVQVQESATADVIRSHLVAGIDQLKEHLYKSKTFAPGELFFRAQFSINPDRLPELKAQLRSLLIEFVEAGESDQGKKVGNLLCAFF